MIGFTLISLCGLIASLIGIWKDGWKTRRRSGILSVLATVAMIYAIYAYHNAAYKERLVQEWGTFDFPTKITRKPDLFFGRYQINSVTLSTESQSDDKWETWLENGKVNLRGTIRDQQGNLVFQVNGTEWKNHSGKEFNYDDRGLEIKDSKGSVTFQLEFDRKENRICVYGVFYLGNDKVVLVGTDETRFVVGQSASSLSDISEFIRSSKPVFKYPRERHLGERVSKTALPTSRVNRADGARADGASP
jgi:hypothetical protein